jgi:hypothetical protein
MTNDHAHPRLGRGIIIDIRPTIASWPPAQLAGLFDVFVAGKLVCTSRRPIRDAGRELIRRGFSPELPLTLERRPDLPNDLSTTLGAAALDVRADNVVPFEPLPPKRPPYRPDAMNGTVWVFGKPGDFAVLHYSSSGDCADVFGKFKTLREAQSAAWREARRRQAIFRGQQAGGQS